MGSIASEANALTLVQDLLNGDQDTTFWDFTATTGDVALWIQNAVRIVSETALCVESTLTITLVSGTKNYTTPATIASIVKVHDVYVADVSGSPIYGIQRYTPKQESHLKIRDTNRPNAYAHFAGAIWVYPTPGASEVGDTLTVFHAKSTETITDLPYAYRMLPVFYATAHCLYKDKKYAEGAVYEAKFWSELQFHRLDLQSKPPDTKDMFKTGDRTVVAQ